MNNCKSLVVVIGHRLICFSYEENKFIRLIDTTCDIGKNGFNDKRCSGDKTTPVGVFKILYAFGTERSVKTELPYKRIKNDSYFCDDDESSFYNSWVESDKPIKGEHLIEYPVEYHYGLVFDFNMNPAVKGVGSSIFLHCRGKKGYTLGCIAIDEKDMVHLLSLLKKDAYIVIIPGN